MAEIKVHLSADARSLERTFEEIKHHAKEVGTQLGEVGTELGKSLTGINFEKLLGIGGAVYAATKLGDALIDAAKEGYKAFQDYQDAVLKFKYNAPSSAGTLEERGKLGTEMAETAESKMGLFSFTQLMNAGVALEQVAGELKLSPEKINGLVDTMQALAIKTGTTPDAIAENFRKLVVSIKEEGSAAVGKFFKATPGLEEEAGKLRGAHAEEYLKDQGVTKETANQDQANEFAKIIAMPIAEFMTKESQRIGAKEVLGETMGIMERASPKSIIQEEQDIRPEAALHAEMEKLSKAFGEELAPAIREITKDITENMPTIRSDLVEFGKTMSGLVPILANFAATVQSVMGGLADRLGISKVERDTANIVAFADARLRSGGIDPDSLLKAKQAPEKQAPEKLERTVVEAAGALDQVEGVDPIVATQKKAAANAETEAAKLNLSTASAHAAAQRRISFEATQAAFEAQTKGAARAGLSGIRPHDSSVKGQESNLDLESRAKIIDIQAAAAAKERALNEESAIKVAKIEEEKAVRKLARDKEDIADTSPAEKAARDMLRAAQDAASQSAIADLQDEAAQRIRDANQAAADKIIDEQLSAANKRADIEYNAAIKAIDAGQRPTHEEGPAGVGTASTFGKHGEVIEGSIDRAAREGRNRQADEQFKAQQESDKAAALAKKTAADQAAAAMAAKQEKEAADKLALQPLIKPFGSTAAALDYKGDVPPPALPGAAPLSAAAQQTAAMTGVVQALAVTNSFLQQILGADIDLLKVFAT